MNQRAEGDAAPHTQGRRLCDFIEERQEDILRAWEERARALLKTAEKLSEPALRDHLPKLLLWISEVVRTAHTGSIPTPGRLPEAHARSRIEEGYDLIEVARELSLLRRVILELWEADGSPFVPVKEAIRLHDAVDHLLARSVQAFAAEQHREVRERLETERQMIGIVSHDLRNPLSTISTSAEGLLRRPLDNPVLRGTVRIRNAALRAGRLIRDLLDFTQERLGSGIPVDRALADLHAIVRRVVEEERALTAHHELVHLEEGDGTAELDPDRIAQIVDNLVTNAVKYSAPDSEVTVRTRGEGGSVTLAVHNSGAPIPPEDIPHLFEPLRRGSEQQRSGGVGLGLFIVQSIVRAHGGEITVTSSASEGTVFSVRLPRKRPSGDAVTSRGS